MKPFHLVVPSMASLIISVGAIAASQTLYPTEDIHIADVGIIPVGTPMQELENHQGKLEVEISGVQPVADTRAIFMSDSQRILLAALLPQASDQLQVGSSYTDAYGNQWRHVSLTTTVPDQVVDSQQPLWQQASQLRDKACAVCHAAPEPSQLTVNAWPATIRSMGSRTALSQQQLHLLTAFFQYHAIHQ
ncbi:hypothetical protein [Shewanella sp. GXUN23E]|uniref:hypothetical protein n=1 Tax=Shewanella sp. GXUN23E TaxID=3422498 RepID=UPI003D7E3B1F